MLNNDLDRQNELIRMAHDRGERLFTEVVNKVINKYKAIGIQEMTDYYAYGKNNFADVENEIKQVIVYRLAEEALKKVQFSHELNPEKFTTTTKGKVYIMSEKEIQGLVWDSYNEALNTMKKEIYDKR